LLLLPSTTYRAAAFVDAARRLDVDLTVGSDHRSVFGGERPESLLAVNLERPEQAAEQAAAFATRYPVNAVFAVDDDTVVAASAICARLGLPYISSDAALAARDKHRQRQILSAAGVEVPAFVRRRVTDPVRDLAHTARYPCVVKPVRLAASRGVIRANDPKEFVRAFERLRAILAAPDVAKACGDARDDILIEQFVGGPEVALEGVMDQGRLRVLAVFDKPDPLDGPFFEETIYVTPSRLARNAIAAITDCAARAARALGISTGPVHAELRYNQQGPWLIELAARPIGGRCGQVLRFGTGDQTTSLEELLLRHALGLEVPSWEREAAAAGVMMIPVPRAGILRDVRGVEAARAVPGIEDVQITAHRGQDLVPWPEGNRYPGFIFGRGATPELVEAALRAAHGALEWVVEGGAGGGGD
jgi:biotin carboxylase